MHDIDRTQLESNPALENYEQEQYEYGEFGEYGETEWSGEAGIFNESQAMELAAELLEVSSEEELDRFLGGLIKKAGQVAGKFIKSPVGQQLGGLLKGAAKQALPMVGSAIGGYFGGGSGAKIGSQVASTAGRIFGLELEGLSHEDQEYEAAKRFVQFAGTAAKNVALSPQAVNPKAVAQSAVAAAARQLAPGLVRNNPVVTSGPCSACGRGTMSGRWVRRGSKIILLGV
ncbi:MAG TPA: hypothetical protein PKD88_00185 [Nitrosomonas sp.]|nr:hypothetical protein [Nitrosomonas sp.]HMW68582.1 hypothetical protein [Nitrosomonas sp.]HMY61202.1 hypothetical protein [Nitrosomonas sp.]HMY89889.1 hypothetical protein [Nitrosomonas sp.]HNA69533.1 hypothetical protein [Nitrosomonas sp.]